MTCSFPSRAKGIDLLSDFQVKTSAVFLQEPTCPFSIPHTQNECLEEVKKHREEVRVFHETYDMIVAQDKVSWCEKEESGDISVQKSLMLTSVSL